MPACFAPSGPGGRGGLYVRPDADLKYVTPAEKDWFLRHCPPIKPSTPTGDELWRATPPGGDELWKAGQHCSMPESDATEEQAEQWLEHNYRHDDESRIRIYRTLYNDN